MKQHIIFATEAYLSPNASASFPMLMRFLLFKTKRMLLKLIGVLCAYLCINMIGCGWSFVCTASFGRKKARFGCLPDSRSSVGSNLIVFWESACRDIQARQTRQNCISLPFGSVVRALACHTGYPSSNPAGAPPHTLLSLSGNTIGRL